MTSSPPCRGQLVRSQQAGSPAVIAEPGKSQVHHDRGMPPAGGVQEHCAELVCGGDVDLWGAVITRTPPVILRRYLISGTGAHLLRRTEAVPESQGVSARRGLRHAAAVRNPGLAPTMACPPGDRTPEPVGGEDREPGAARTWAWPGVRLGQQREGQVQPDDRPGSLLPGMDSPQAAGLDLLSSSVSETPGVRRPTEKAWPGLQAKTPPMISVWTSAVPPNRPPQDP